MIVGIGIDVVDVPRFRGLLRSHSAEDLFLPAEIAYCETQARPWECLAGRAAAKRALSRALGEEGEFGRAVEVIRRDAGDVELHLTDGAREAVELLGATHWWVSITHTKNTSLAVVVLESPDRPARG